MARVGDVHPARDFGGGEEGAPRHHEIARCAGHAVVADHDGERWRIDGEAEGGLVAHEPVAQLAARLTPHADAVPRGPGAVGHRLGRVGGELQSARRFLLCAKHGRTEGQRDEHVMEGSHRE